MTKIPLKSGKISQKSSFFRGGQSDFFPILGGVVVVQHLLLKVRVPSQLSLNDCGPVSNTLLKVCGEVFISFRPGVYIQTFSAYIIVVIDMNY